MSISSSPALAEHLRHVDNIQFDYFEASRGRSVPSVQVLVVNSDVHLTSTIRKNTKGRYYTKPNGR